MFDCVRADIQGATRDETTAPRKIGRLLFNQGLHAVLLYRVSRWFFVHHMQPLGVFVRYLNSILTGADISPHTAIGKGLRIPHPQGMAIAARVIGEYCTLYHGNLIGELRGSEDRPHIGHHFFAGTGAKVLGDIQIGNRVTVGPNAVVVTSLPDDVTVAASPTRMIRRAPASVERTRARATQLPVDGSRVAILRRLVPLLPASMKGSGEDLSEATVLLGGGMDLDSLRLLILIGAIEEEFSLTIDDEEVQLPDFETLGSLVTIVQERLGG